MPPKKTKSVIKSIFGKDGKFLKDMQPVENVGELKSLLNQLPDNLPIRVGMAEGTKLVWFNVGLPDEHLGIEENDETFDL